METVERTCRALNERGSLAAARHHIRLRGPVALDLARTEVVPLRATRREAIGRRQTDLLREPEPFQ